MEKPVKIKVKYTTLETPNLPKIPANIAATPRPEIMDSRKSVRSRFIKGAQLEWLAACAWKPKIPGSSPTATYV